MKCLDDEFRRWWAMHEKYLASHAEETLEAKVKGLSSLHATDLGYGHGGVLMKLSFMSAI